MNKPIEIIKARRWVNATTGATASVFGAVPYVSESDKPNWKIETVGYTFKRADGTVSAGPNGPFKTYAEALDVFHRLTSRA